VASYIPTWFTRPQTVTHPSINRARRRVTTLIETLSQVITNDSSHVHNNTTIRQAGYSDRCNNCIE